MEIRGIIFDLDGTVLNTIEDIGDSMNMVLKDLGLEELGYSEYKQRVGGGFKKLVEDILGPNRQEELGLLEGYYRANYLNKSRPYPGIVEMLEELQGQGIKLAINTNKNQEYATRLIREKFPQIDFIDVVGVDEKNLIKPDPRPGLGLIEKMGLAKDQVLYVGDSNVDILTGKNIGLKTVGVDWGFRGEEELKAYGASHIIFKPGDLLGLV